MSKIDIFGDSVLKGVIYDEQAQKYMLYENRLTTVEKDGNIVKNNSHMGATVEKGYAMLSRRMDSDVVILSYGGNDCNFDWSKVSQAPDEKHLPNTPPERFVKIYRDIIELARLRGATVYMTNLVPLDAEKFMAWISKDLSYENILQWLGDVNILYRWQESYNRLVEKLASDMGCGLIDIRSPFLCRHDFSSLFCKDGIHPTPKGHDIIREALRQYNNV